MAANEESLLFRETPEEAASRIIREAAPFAAQSISDMATDECTPPSVRLRAAQYIIDRNLGPVSAATAEQDKLEAFLEELSREANSGH